VQTVFDYDDVVKLKKSLKHFAAEADESSSLPKGALGTIVMVHDERVGANCHPPEYEVEFVNNDGHTLAVLTLKESDLELV
jgi:hypothetical protein